MIAEKPDLHSLIEKAATFSMLLEHKNISILAQL